MPASTASLTFTGTATTVLRLSGFTLLTDTNLLTRGQRAYLGKGLWSRRITHPKCSSAIYPVGRMGNVTKLLSREPR